MKNHYLIAVLALLLGAGPLRAQVALFTPDTIVAPGELITIPVRAQDFSNIATAQFSVNWNTAVLVYEGLTDLNLPGLSADNLSANFGVTTAPDGRIGFLWSEENFNGYTLADNDQLFSIVMRATGADGDTTSLTLTGDPTDIEIANPAGEVQTVAISAGLVRIDASVPTTGPRMKTNLIRLQGNPLQADSKLQFDFDAARQVQLTWQAVTGRRLQSQTYLIPAGQHTQPIVTPVSLPAGMYFLQIQTTDFTVAHPVLLVR